MRLRSWFTAFALSYFGLVFIKDGTAKKLINDTARGANDIVGGLKRPAGLA